MSAGLTLDGLFRRAGVRNAHEPALLDVLASQEASP